MVDHGAVPYADPFCDGFGWDEEGELVWPGKGDGNEREGKPAPPPDAYVSRLTPRKRGPVVAATEANAPLNPFFVPGSPFGSSSSSSSPGVPEFGERPPVFRFEDIPSQ